MIYQPAHSSSIASTQDLFTQVGAFYSEINALQKQILDLSNKEALTALEKLTNTTKDNPRPVMPLSCALSADIPALSSPKYVCIFFSATGMCDFRTLRLPIK
ncbi:MAG: hypothetical protein ACXVCM_24845 [Ktedonobacteraceae bacterium]